MFENIQPFADGRGCSMSDDPKLSASGQVMLHV
jgi:hypothetical protein